MKKYEYKVEIDTRVWLEKEWMANLLNGYGKMGWKLVAVTYRTTSDDQMQFIYYMRRILIETDTAEIFEKGLLPE
jgi:hypothetical protein